MEITDRDRLDFLESGFDFLPRSLSNVNFTLVKFFRILDEDMEVRQITISEGKTKREAIDNAIMAMREKGK